MRESKKKKKVPKHTSLYVVVHYVNDVRVVYMRNNLTMGPQLSHMYPEDVFKIFPAVQQSIRLEEHGSKRQKLK